MSSESDDSRSLLASVFGDLFVDSEPPDPIRENLRVEQVVPTPPEARYELRDLLGRGGVGEVRRALDHALHRKVAIKTLREDLADRPGQVQRF